jgi:hypothetical protein
VAATSERSFESIDQGDLSRLSAIAAQDREQRFERKPRWAVYRDRVVGVALCQGAAQHYIDGSAGVKDLDVWTFFAEHESGPFPARWRTTADFGQSQLGRHPLEAHLFSGRRVDLIGRSLPVGVGADAAKSITEYLQLGRTASARALAAKAVVLLDPPSRRGLVIWPTDF